jgi:hypothetical protein
VRASVPLTFLSFLLSNTLAQSDRQAHFAKSIAFTPNLQDIGSNTMNLSAMRYKVQTLMSHSGTFSSEKSEDELWLGGDLGPVEALCSGVLGEGFFILDQNCPDNT